MTKPVQFARAIRSWADVSTQHAMRGWSHHAKATGLSMPQFSILMQIYQRGNCGISDISDRFEITAAAASQHVENLFQAGLISRAEDPNDRRAKKIRLSEKGKALLERSMSARYDWVDRLAARIDAMDHEKLANALCILTEAARKLDETQ